MVHIGLSLMLEAGWSQAALPLLEAGQIDALEYSFEIGWTSAGRPEWAEALLAHFAEADRLWGHGVTMSPFSVEAATRQPWLRRVRQDCARWRMRGVSEHVGFMEAGDLDGGAPLPVPHGPGAVRAAVRGLQQLRDATGTRVGLENLALALSRRDVEDQGRLLTEVLEGVDGYLVLDLHNLWCQATNFDVDAARLLDDYPLARASCIHVSGGRWSEPDRDGVGRPFRRDTHDDGVPSAVLELLDEALPRCPNLEVVFVERLGPTLQTAAAQDELRTDVVAVRSIVEAADG